MKRTLLLIVFLVCAGALPSLACKFTPLEWQARVEKHSITALVGQKKHMTWIRDANHDFIDDEITARFHPGEAVDIVVDLNDCLTPGQIKEILGRYGRVDYVGKLVTFVLMSGVHFENLRRISELPQVAMIEWQVPSQISNDVSNRAIQSRASNTFSPNTAQDAGFNGSGVTVAVIDTGADEGHEAIAGKFVAGFNALNAADPGDGSTHPGDDQGHGTHVSSTAVGNGTTGRSCRSPNDGSTANCAGVAPGASLVIIKVCNSMGGCPDAAIQKGLDWLGVNAARFNVRAANMSFGNCTADDGTSAESQQVNYLVAIGVSMQVAAGNASNCSVAPGTALMGSPASASYAITVAGTNDQGTVARTDDTIFSDFMVGPRSDFNAASPDLLAMKPDISAPGQNIFAAQAGTVSSYVSKTGTSMATPHVTGAAALLINARPQIDPSSLKDLLKRSADTSKNVAQFPAVDATWDREFGAGMLNLWPAISAVASTDVKFPNCVGPPATPGGLCALTPPLPPWDNTADISTATPPKAGVPNTLTAQVRNNGPSTATVLVNFGVYVFAVGNNQFFHVGTVQVTIAPNTTIPVSVPWTPASSDHQCAQVNIQFGFDSDYTNNVTQRNLQVAPSVYTVRVENPFMVPAKFELRPKSNREGWQCKLSETNFELDPFEDCPRKVRVAFNAPKDTKPGERATCDLAVYATPRGEERARLIGGVSMETYVPKPCRMLGEVRDSQGAPIAGARLSFERDLEGNEGGTPASGKAETGADGTFDVVLPAGYTYNVVIDAKGEKPVRTTVQPDCGACSMNFVVSKGHLSVALK